MANDYKTQKITHAPPSTHSKQNENKHSYYGARGYFEHRYQRTVSKKEQRMSVSPYFSGLKAENTALFIG